MGESTTPGPSEFPQAIGRVALRELALNGFTTFDQLTRVSAKDFLKIHGVGPKAVLILGEALRERGKVFLDGSALG